MTVDLNAKTRLKIARVAVSRANDVFSVFKIDGWEGVAMAESAVMIARIEALEAENERLREALKDLASRAQSHAARAALKGDE